MDKVHIMMVSAEILINACNDFNLRYRYIVQNRFTQSLTRQPWLWKLTLWTSLQYEMCDTIGWVAGANPVGIEPAARPSVYVYSQTGCVSRTACHTVCRSRKCCKLYISWGGHVSVPCPSSWGTALENRW